MNPNPNLLRLVLTSILLLLPTGCASVLTTWHDKAYTAVVDPSSPLVRPAAEAAAVEEAADLARSADELYAEGYVLIGYTKFSHTLVPGFQRTYAKMYGNRIGAARVLQAEPKKNGNVWSYTVTYWAEGASFPLGAYYNDIPEETAMFFPDSLRETIGEGHRPVLVEEVVRGTPAEAAGLEKGELIVAVDGVPITGTDALDALIPERANQEVTLTVWGLSGLRETTCTIGERNACADGYGTEGLYFNQPWAFDDHEEFQQVSQAFTNAWNSGLQAYAAAQEQARVDGQIAYLNTQTSYLQGRIEDLERMPSQRASRGTPAFITNWKPDALYEEFYGDRR